MGYDLIEGNITQSLRGFFVSKDDGSKNTEARSLDRDRPILWNKVRHDGIADRAGASVAAAEKQTLLNSLSGTAVKFKISPGSPT